MYFSRLGFFPPLLLVLLASSFRCILLERRFTLCFFLILYDYFTERF